MTTTAKTGATAHVSEKPIPVTALTRAADAAGRVLGRNVVVVTSRRAPKKTEDGVVLMARVVYDELFADIEDALARAALAATRDEEAFPVDVVDALLAGENPVRVFRRYRDMKAGELAAAAGISASMLSEIETGKKDGSAKTLAAIADALDVTVDDLV